MPTRSAPAPTLRLRALCMLLPGVIEKEAWGSPTFRAGPTGKIFAQLELRAGTPAVSLPAAPGEQALLVDLDPGHYFVPPYVGPKGWVGVVLDGGTDWDQLTEVVLAAYRHVSHRKLADALESPRYLPGELARTSYEAALTMKPPPPPFDPALVESSLARVREICLALPEVAEKAGNHTAFQVAGKTFTWFLVNHHGDRHLGVQVKAAPGVQGMLVDAAPGRFYVPQYMGVHGWVGLELKDGADWHEVRALLHESYRLVAPRRLLARLDSAASR